MVVASALATAPPTTGWGSVLHPVGQICVFPTVLPNFMHPGGLGSKKLVNFVHFVLHSCILIIWIQEFVATS